MLQLFMAIINIYVFASEISYFEFSEDLFYASLVIDLENCKISFQGGKRFFHSNLQIYC